MVLKRHGLSLLSIFFSCIIVIALFAAGQASAGTVRFTKNGMSTRSGEEETEFVFTLTVTSEEEPEEPIEVVVENKGHIMKEIDKQDSDYSDGKEFSFKARFDEGPKFYYYRCANDSTRTYTFEVKESRFFEEYHPDLVLAMAIYVIPIVYFLFLMHRFRKSISALTQSLRTVSVGMVDPRQDIGGKGEIVELQKVLTAGNGNVTTEPDPLVTNTVINQIVTNRPMEKKPGREELLTNGGDEP